MKSSALKLDQKVKCKFCGNDVVLESGQKVGNYIECPNCKAEMQILSLEPPEVSLLEEEK